MARRTPAAFTRVATLGGDLAPVALPAWSLRLRLREAPSVARHIFLGDPDFSRAGEPWHYVEQMGVAHRLVLGDRPLTILTCKHGRLLTEARFIVEPGTPAA